MNVMNPSLDLYIAELLYDYDCVVVPQLGGFVTNYRPAGIDVRKSLALPPGKDVRFNRNLTKNDGLLAAACAEANGWSFEEAGTFVREEVAQYLSKLHDGNQLKLKKIGILYFDAEKNLRFEPDATQNFLKQSWGFETFALPEKLVKPTALAGAKVIAMPDPVPEPVASSATVAMPEGNSARSEHTRSIYWVAAATLMPFLAFSLYLGMRTDFKSPAEYTPADLNPFNTSTKVPRMYAPNTFPEKENDPITERAFPEGLTHFPYTFSTGVADSTGLWINLAQTERPSPATVREERSSGGAYHIIGGCFGEKANAKKYVDRLRVEGHDAGVLDYHKGLHRVRIISFAHYDDALEALSAMRDTKEFGGAWLLKKHMKH
jgi:hypothetical protein